QRQLQRSGRSERQAAQELPRNHRTRRTRTQRTRRTAGQGRSARRMGHHGRVRRPVLQRRRSHHPQRQLERRIRRLERDLRRRQPGTFSGKLEGSTTSVEVTTPPYAPANLPGTTFTSKAMMFEYTVSSMSISGSGTSKVEGGPEFPTTMTATRIKTYGQVLERETAEREAKETQEREAREAKEKAEREEKEKREREEKERQEALEKAKLAEISPPPLKTPPQIIPPINPLVPVLLAVNTLTVGPGGALALMLENHGASPEHGLLKLTLAKGGKAASTKHSSAGATLGQGSFAIAAHGSEVVSVKLSKSGRA